MGGSGRGGAVRAVLMVHGEVSLWLGAKRAMKARHWARLGRGLGCTGEGRGAAQRLLGTLHTSTTVCSTTTHLH
jgi:hypothetical protein